MNNSTLTNPVRPLIAAVLIVLALNTGCSIRKYAINKLGDAFARSGTSFASDDDPDLIKDAVPFSLKLIEGLLAESPRHRGLLFAASSGFTQYSYAFVQQKADELEDRDLAKATALRRRARRLYLRARNYGLRGLEAGHRGFEKALRENPKAARASRQRPTRRCCTGRRLPGARRSRFPRTIRS